MDVVIERCAGLDIAKKTVAVTVRTPGRGGRRQSQTRTFGTMTVELLALRDWLVEQRVTTVGMESTGAYWKPVYYLLEDVVECQLLNARHLRNVPGRKTDVKDSAWIAQIVEHGLVQPSFVPPAPIRELRDLTRYRKTIVQERTREAQRLEKTLEDAGIKLSAVASSILGVSARDMLSALVAGERDPKVLADLAQARLRSKIPELRLALLGQFRDHHALLIREMLIRIDAADATIARLGEQIDHLLAPFRAQIDLLMTIPGVGRRTAEVIIAETGGDMTRFPTPEQLASWAGVCPGNNESAGKHHSGRTRDGNKWLCSALVESAYAAARTRDTYLAAQFWRLAGRRGKPRAAVAVAHSILIIAYHVLARGQRYQELGADYLTTRGDRQAHTRRLIRQLEALGHKVTIQPADPRAA
jgi:transposase